MINIIRKKEKKPEIVFVEGLMCQIDYNKKKIYYQGLEIANLDNITVPLSRKGIKEVLMDKVYYMRCCIKGM